MGTAGSFLQGWQGDQDPAHGRTVGLQGRRLGGRRALHKLEGASNPNPETTMTVLRIDASARFGGSVTRRLADRIVERLGDPEVIHRDLAAEPPALVTEEMIAAYFTPSAERTDAQRVALAPSDAVVDELRRADTVVIALPIYNFSVPANLKAWADLAARVGETFRYADDGPKGLLEGKRAILAVASGGTAVGSGIDFATPWLRFFLGFIGITDVRVFTADRLHAGADARVDQAYADIDGQLAA